MKTCTIRILNDVFSNVEGIDKHTKDLCIDKLSFLVPHRFHVASFKLKRWDGKERFFAKNNTNKIYTNLLPEVIDIIESRGYTFEFIDERQRQTIDIPKISKDIFADHLWPEDHRLAGEPVMLRDDQEKAANIFADNRYAVQELSTGYGKTILTAAICKQVEHLGRTITIVPSKSLVKQTYNDFLLVGLDAGMYFSEEKTTDKQHIISTWQSIDRLVKNYDKEPLAKQLLDEMSEGVVQVLVDECHSAKAKALGGFLGEHFKDIPLRRGFTGTIHIEPYDYNYIIGNIGPVVHRVSAKELQEQGFLSECKINIIRSTLENRSFDNYHQETNYITSDLTNLNYYADLIKQIVNTGNTIVLVNGIETGEYLSSILGWEFVSGTTSLKNRDKAYSAINKSVNGGLIATYGVAAVGINIPSLHNVVLVEAGKSFVRVIQSIGRGLRLAKNKDMAVIWDFTTSYKYSKKHCKKRIEYYDNAYYPYTEYDLEPEQMLLEVEKILKPNE